jgi:hypothetical protein
MARIFQTDWIDGLFMNWRVGLKESEPDAENARSFSVHAGVDCRVDESAPAATHLREENRVLHEQLGNRRILLNDDQRRRLAVRTKTLGRELLAEVATLVTPDTLLACIVS